MPEENLGDNLQGHSIPAGMRRRISPKVVGHLFGGLKGFCQKRSIAGVSQVQIALLDQEIAEGFQLGIPQTAGGFGKLFRQAFQEVVNLVRSDGIEGRSANRASNLCRRGESLWTVLAFTLDL